MTGPLSAPWTEIGRLQSEIQSLNSKLQGKVNSYEVSSLTSSMASLECTIREISSTLDGFRNELSELQENVRQVLSDGSNK